MGNPVALGLWNNPIFPRAFDVLALPSKAITPFVRRELSSLPPRSRVLDAGIGTGLVARSLSQKGFSVTGVDISKDSLDIARARVPDADLLTGSILDIPAPRSYFDATVALYVLRYVDVSDGARAAAELRRVTRPGGKVLVGDLALPSLRPGAARLAGPDRYALGVWSDREGFRRAMEREGFDLSSVHYPFLSFLWVFA